MVRGRELKKNRAWSLPSGATEDSLRDKNIAEQAVPAKCYLNTLSIMGASEITSCKKWSLFELKGRYDFKRGTWQRSRSWHKLVLCAAFTEGIRAPSNSLLPRVFCQMGADKGTSTALPALIWKTCYGIKGTHNSCIDSGKQHFGEFCTGTRLLYNMGKILTGIRVMRKKVYPLCILYVGSTGLWMSFFFHFSFPTSSVYAVGEYLLVQTGFKASPVMYSLCPQTSYLTSLSLSFSICKGTTMPTPRTVEEVNEIMCVWQIELSKDGIICPIPHALWEPCPHPINRWCLILPFLNRNGLVTNRMWRKWCRLTLEAGL